MNILADENLDAPLVAWLRTLGHDVLWLAEAAPGCGDAEALAMAGQQRVLVTQDRDFGELVYCRGGRCAGVIYLRLRTRTAPDLLRAFQIAWPRIQTQVVGHFITVSAAKVRIRVLPPLEGAG